MEFFEDFKNFLEVMMFIVVIITCLVAASFFGFMYEKENVETDFFCSACGVDLRE